MNSKKRKGILIFIGMLLFLFYSPIAYFKAHTNIETQNSINEKNINGSTTKIDTHSKGISWSVKETTLKNDSRFKVNLSSVLNLGIYTKIKKKISLERMVNNELIKTVVIIESEIWGLGRLSLKKNNLNNSIKTRIDQIYSET